MSHIKFIVYTIIFWFILIYPLNAQNNQAIMFNVPLETLHIINLIAGTPIIAYLSPKIEYENLLIDKLSLNARLYETFGSDRGDIAFDDKGIHLINPLRNYYLRGLGVSIKYSWGVNHYDGLYTGIGINRIVCDYRIYNDNTEKILEEASKIFYYPKIEIGYRHRLINNVFGSLDFSYGCISGESIPKSLKEETGWALMFAYNIGILF